MKIRKVGMGVSEKEYKEQYKRNEGHEMEVLLELLIAVNGIKSFLYVSQQCH